jgi:hypothetical protein
MRKLRKLKNVLATVVRQKFFTTSIKKKRKKTSRVSLSFNVIMLATLRTYCDASSVHGFAYLTTKNHIVIRMAWLIALPSAFSICGYMIWTQVDEAAKNPVASNLQSVPASEVPFPTLTFSSNQQETSLETFFERLFNRLPFDCSQTSGDNATHCLKESGKVKTFFKQKIETVFNGLFAQHINASAGKLNNFLHRDECGTLEKYRFDVIQPLLDKNLTQNEFDHLQSRLRQIAFKAFLLPKNQRKTPKQLLKPILDHYNISEEMIMPCGEVRDLSRWSGDKLIPLIQTFLLFVQAEKIPLGTFLRSEVKTSTLLIYFGLFIDQQKMTKKLLSSLIDFRGHEGAFFDMVNYQDGRESCIMQTYPERGGSCDLFRINRCETIRKAKKNMTAEEAEGKKFVHRLTMGIPPFFPTLSSKSLDVLAEKGARKLGLTSSLDGSGVIESPFLWHCRAKTMISACTDLQLSLTENGYGFSLNMGDWYDTFKTNLFEKRPEEVEKRRKIAAFDDELTLYIYNLQDQ